MLSASLTRRASDRLVTLLPLTLARIAAIRLDGARLDDIPIVDGALPPTFIVDDAALALADGRSTLWFTPYLFVDDEGSGRERVVGSGIFKGEPDDGWVEIGYGVAAACAGLGHATAGAFALVRLALSQPDVRAVYAETSVFNPASRRVVQKVGFRHAGQRTSEDDGLVDCWFVEA